MKAFQTIRRERLAAFLALLFASALVTYTATASIVTPAQMAPVKPRTLKPSQAPQELLQPIPTVNTNFPVNGTARAADEPPSPAAVRNPRKLSATDVTTPRYRTIRMEVTAYCACRECCGPNARGLTASGQPVSFNRGHFVAADTDLLPFGTKLVIPGYNRNRPVPVADRGGAIQGRRLDLFFPSHAQAQQWGRQWITVTIVDN